MSNPDPNLRPDLRRARERHAGPLIGMALVVIFAVALIFWWMMDEAADAPGPGGDVTIEQNTGTAPPAAEGEGATDLPDPAPGTVTPEPDVAPAPEPEPAPDVTPAPDTTPGTTAPAPAD